MSATPLSLIGHVPRSLDAETIKACATAGSDSEITTLWGRIKDWVFGTHKVDAKLAIFQMANAQTAHEQFSAFIRLTRYVEPQHFHQLQWCVDKDSHLSFKIGDHAFASNAQWASQTPLMLDMEDMSRLLLSLRYDGHDVADAFREIGVKRLHEAAASATASGSGPAVDINADSLLTMQQQYLCEAPVLLAALEIIGLHRNDDEGDMAYRLRQTMEALKESTSIDRDDDMAAIVGRNAESLMSLVTALFHERERDKRASQAVTLPQASAQRLHANGHNTPHTLRIPGNPVRVPAHDHTPAHTSAPESVSSAGSPYSQAPATGRSE